MGCGLVSTTESGPFASRPSMGRHLKIDLALCLFKGSGGPIRASSRQAFPVSFEARLGRRVRDFSRSEFSFTIGNSPFSRLLKSNRNHFTRIVRFGKGPRRAT